MERYGQCNVSSKCINALLRLYATKGIGERAIDRVIYDLWVKKEKLEILLNLPALEISTRFKIRIDIAEDILRNDQLAEKLYTDLNKDGITVLIKHFNNYPQQLIKVLGAKAPPVLFAKGNLDILKKPAVGICGSRKTSEKGLDITKKAVKILAKKGVNIISGHAQGVDITAHRTAMEAGGVTTIVMAEGILLFKPKSIIKDFLTDKNHLILSNFQPMAHWTAGQAMARNKIITGLSKAALVIESGSSGGTFEAGKDALNLKCPLYVVEYSKPSSNAAGNDYFLKRGANRIRQLPSGKPNLKNIIKSIEMKSKSDMAASPLGQNCYDTMNLELNLNM